MTINTSWGNYPPNPHQQTKSNWWQLQGLPQNTSCLPYGNGRSYGDSCHNQAGLLLKTNHLAHFITYNNDNGLIRCGSGILLRDILAHIKQDGWCLPVMPGTLDITLGGAIANDVHGKNHWHRGNFGHHVKQLALKRSNNEILICSIDENPELFKATLGGLGLTGLILWAEIQLVDVPGYAVTVKKVKFNNLSDGLTLLKSSLDDYEYAVAWLDCFDPQGRGILSLANHSQSISSKARRGITIPCNAPRWLLNYKTIKLVNQIIFNRTIKPYQQALEPFLFPLDHIKHWNRLYGKPGFLQCQVVVPFEQAETVFQQLLETINQAKQGSFLAVLKAFGESPSYGLLSFPRPGFTLALDFPNRGDKTVKLIQQLYEITINADGAIYPAKDVCMTPKMFKQSFAKVDSFTQYIDPGFTSDFWQRVTKDG